MADAPGEQGESNAEQVSPEEIVAALYRGILKREPDPYWMSHHANTLRKKGISAGMTEVVAHFMGGATGLADLAGSMLAGSSRVHLKNVIKAFADRMAPGSRMLDVGAGFFPYRDLFAQVNYESADFRKVVTAKGETTYVCDICAHIPVADGYFDYLVFNQVMEHLKEPGLALAELYRILRPGGLMLTTAPLFYEEHDMPSDYYRYTKSAHRYMFEKSGFAIETLEWLEGFFGTCGYMLESIYRHAPGTVAGAGPDARWARSFLAAIKPLCLVAAGSFYRLDLLWKITDSGFPKNYVIVARKPAEREAPPPAANSEGTL